MTFPTRGFWPKQLMVVWILQGGSEGHFHLRYSMTPTPPPWRTSPRPARLRKRS